jgi:hypothetical protein
MLPLLLSGHALINGRPLLLFGLLLGFLLGMSGLLFLGWNHGPDGDYGMDSEHHTEEVLVLTSETVWGPWNLQRNYTNSKERLRLHTVSLKLVRGSEVAVLGDVPWWAIVLSSWVDGVRTRLPVYAICPQANKQKVNQEGYNGPENVEGKHRELGQQDEHA